MIYLVCKVDNLTEQNKQLLERLMKLVDITKYELINIKFYRLKEKDKFHICLGEAAYQSTKQFVGNLDKLVKISDVHELIDITRNQKSREDSYNTLKNLNQFIKLRSNYQVNPNILENISSLSFIDIKQDLINQNITGFTALDFKGNKVRIIVSEQDTVKEDINISIEELINLKLIHEVFETTSPIIVTKEKK
jgi:hypothetical protein